ncbi:DUF2637 domain-containing protein [Nocardiopsis listeri]|uniref:DUF2637 domain-containing protein n=1 Tax=Nocardiopsis listeri TaxID=53440 RepID=UPI00082D7F1A|nr:DUF2637 domain-containing protein [Nocardiopsis listeri]
MTAPRWSRWVTIAAVLLLALIAAVVSYSHMYELALRHGEPEWRAALFPLSVDGMIVASSMTLLSDARNGRKGGILPWTLLIIGSGASLAANVAVADATMWSRIIHAWPSFALIGAYELLMREFRTAAESVRNAKAERTHTEDDFPSLPGEKSQTEEAGLYVVREQGTGALDGAEETRPTPPETQVRAWRWALDHQREHGALPTGDQIATTFERKPRWGRLVKQRGQRGRLGAAV